jgi:hypothetical protein
VHARAAAPGGEISHLGRVSLEDALAAFSGRRDAVTGPCVAFFMAGSTRKVSSLLGSSREHGGFLSRRRRILDGSSRTCRGAVPSSPHFEAGVAEGDGGGGPRRRRISARAPAPRLAPSACRRSPKGEQRWFWKARRPCPVTFQPPHANRVFREPRCAPTNAVSRGRRRSRSHGGSTGLSPRLPDTCARARDLRAQADPP